jgi:IS30 family transposase
MKQYNTKQEKKYTHFSLAEREEIAIGLELGKSRSEIARNLGRNKSNVCREMQRYNATLLNTEKYRSNQAHKWALERKKEAHQRGFLADPITKAYIELHLKEGWAPEAIAGRLPLDIPGIKTNYESIYLWIYKQRRDLIKYLARGHKIRHKRSVTRKSRVNIPGRVDISERPAHIENRQRIGHWEADTVVSRQSKEATAVFVERKSRVFFVIKMKDKSASSMHLASLKALSWLPANLRRTITYDNGLENALHELTNLFLGTKSYFCKPYHSWEKGSIENRNGILRRYFPKKHDWRLTTQKQIDKVIRNINSTPMKCLGYKTPYEVFANLTGVALRH